MKGIIVVNGYDGNESQRKKVNRMLQEFAALQVAVSVIPNNEFIARIENSHIVTDVDCDFALYFDKDKYVAEMLQRQGVRLFNSARATEICDDKMLTHLVLAGANVPMPDTIACPLCYNQNAVITDQYANALISKLGLPLVVKQCYGGFGKQVRLARTQSELLQIANEWKTTAHLYQKFVEQSCGRDMRVIVIGGKTVCGMIRRNDGDFRSNVELGGVGSGVAVPASIAETCEKAAKIIGLDYCGIDVLLGDEPQICEVNSNAMFNEIERVTGVNVARLYVEHIINETKIHTQRKTQVVKHGYK